MVAHQFLCFVSIAAVDGVDDRLMFRVRLAHAAGLIGDIAPIRVDAVAQSAAFSAGELVYQLGFASFNFPFAASLCVSGLVLTLAVLSLMRLAARPLEKIGPH